MRKLTRIEIALTALFVPLLLAAATTARPVAAQRSAVVPVLLASPRPDAGLRLQSLLGEHSVLAADMMRGRIRGDEDFLQAANAALTKNTDDMAQLVGSLFGGDAAKQFSSVWAAHVAALFTYARGIADHDDKTRDDAHNQLAAFERDIASFFANASGGRLPPDAAQAAVLAHVDHLLHQADKYAAGDFAGANAEYRAGYQHTYGLGETLARALLSPDDVKALDAPSWRLRSQLGQLLGEHVQLVIDATRAGVQNSKDFAAAGDVVNANTRDLAGAMSTLFGGKAATSFQSLWADHVDQIMVYTTATVSRNTQQRDEARQKLTDFENRLAAFIAGATQRRMPTADVAKALVMHDEMLLQQVDAYAAKDYRKAHEIADSTYAHMYDLSGQLADAFGATVAARLPKGGAETGSGGAAGDVGHR
jgi:hypothetical protein